MKVKELREELAKYPDDMSVLMDAEDSCLTIVDMRVVDTNDIWDTNDYGVKVLLLNGDDGCGDED